MTQLANPRQRDYLDSVSLVARMERSGMREQIFPVARKAPDCASLHPGYKYAPLGQIFEFSSS
jgi:hypothetical protein